MTDVLVAGGGPAGLATAIYAALAGLSATVIEPQTGIIDKACGEGLMPPAVQALEAMGVTVTGYPMVGIRYIDGERRVEARFRQGPGLGVRRVVLHEGLQARADQLGVQRIVGRVAELKQDSQHVHAQISARDGSLTPLKTSWLVAADGLHSKLRHRLDLGAPSHHPPRYGVRRHYRVAPWSEFVEVYWSPHAEAYVTPVAGDTVGVAILFAGKGTFDDLLPQFPVLQARLSDPCSSTMGGGPFEQRVRRRIQGRVLLVGDAAGFLDPLTGEGLRLGLVAASQLVNCIDKGEADRYEAAWRRLTSHYWLMTGGLLHLMRRPFTRRLIVPFLQCFPGVFAWGLDYLMS